MADRLRYNIDDLEEQARSMRDVAEKLEGAKSDLKANLETLRGDWVSGASTKFFSSIDSDWESAVSHYVEMLRDLADALEEAAGKYDPLEDEYRKITLG